MKLLTLQRCTLKIMDIRAKNIKNVPRYTKPKLHTYITLIMFTCKNHRCTVSELNKIKFKMRTYLVVCSLDKVWLKDKVSIIF